MKLTGSARLAPGEQQTKRHRGFTMIELIVVMVVIGIVATVAVVRFSMLDSFAEAAYSNEIKSVLSYARKISVARRRHVCAIFNAQSEVQLTAELSTPENHTGSCTGYPVLATPSGTDGLKPPKEVRITSPDLPFTIEFDHEGRPTAAHTIVLTNHNSGETVTIQLEAESGYAH